MYTGLRIGELCALKWTDINFELSVLTVNGTQARTENVVEIISPKSKTSKREIPIPPFLLDKIKSLSRKTTSIIHYSSAVGDFIFHYKNPFLMNDEY